MLAESNLLELRQPVTLGGAVNDRVLEQVAVEAVVVDGALDARLLLVARRGLNLPRVAALVVREAREVVALVEVLEDGAEDLGLLVGERDALGRRVHVRGAQRLREKGTGAEDVLVGGKEALLGADDEGDDAGGDATVRTFCVSWWVGDGKSQRRGEACREERQLTWSWKYRRFQPWKLW